MKVPKHLPFLILVVSAIHAVIITTIWPRGARRALPSDTAPDRKTTGYIDESDQAALQVKMPRNPLSIMIAEEESAAVSIPEKDGNHTGEVIQEAAAQLFPIPPETPGQPSAAAASAIGNAPEEKTGVLVASVESEDLGESAESLRARPIESEEVYISEVGEVEKKPRVKAKIPKMEFPDPALLEEKVRTTPDDIAKELNGLVVVEDDGYTSDSAVAAAMRMWEKKGNQAVTPVPVVIESAAVEKGKADSLPIVKTGPKRISPPPIQ